MADTRPTGSLLLVARPCIANRVEPTEYLTDVLPRIAQAKTDAELDALLPDRWRPSGPAP
jgi:hypothetical protein